MPCLSLMILTAGKQKLFRVVERIDKMDQETVIHLSYAMVAKR